MKLGAKELRVTKPSEEDLSKIRRLPVWLVLDNVLDTYNIGSLFRLADAVAVKELIICGQSETPPSSRIHRAAIGTEEWVPWRYEVTAAEAIKKLRAEIEGIKVVAVEQDERAINLGKLIGIKKEESMAIVIGHETDGVSREVLDAADLIVEIPMWGVNKSLNVHVSAAIVVYKLLA